MRKKCVACVACGVAFSSAASAAPTVWEIDQPWEFYTANSPAQTRLTGTLTFDRDVSEYYIAAWDLTLVHFDPVFAADYPINIEGSFPNLSDASGYAFVLREDLLTSITIRFQSADQQAIMDGTVSSVAFAANEYVQRGPFSSQRIINNGVMTLVPSPGVLAIAGISGFAGMRRRL